MSEYTGLIAICAKEGEGKTSMSLTWPKPIYHMDIDLGGYARASWRIDTTGITSKSYPKPIQKSKMLGQTKNDASTRIELPKKTEGMKELWQEIVNDFVDACLNPEIATIVIDSATKLYVIGCNAWLQELQERQLANWNKEHKNIPFDENTYRERLTQMEYGEVYKRLDQIFDTAKSCSKNLILTHYPTDEYGPMPDGKGNIVTDKTGNKIMDGYKRTAENADLVVWLSVKETIKDNIKNKQPVAKIHKPMAGMGLNAVGMEVAADYDSIINLRNMLRGS